MNKKLILLMLALPLILMLSLFTATNTVSLVINVPVTKVVINDDDVIYMDLEEEYEISYTVYPTNAANKKVVFASEPYGNSVFANVKIVDGKIVAESCGKAKITVTTVDGGFKDSFVVEITTTKLQSISSTVEKELIKLGDSVDIVTVFNPLSAQYQTQLKYEVVEGAGVVSVSPKGKVLGESVGKAKIKVYCAIDNSVFSEVEVEVENSHPLEFLKKSETVTTQQLKGELKLFVNENASFTYFCEVFDENNQPYGDFSYTLDKDGGKLEYEFTNQEPCSLTIRLTVTTDEGTYVDECKLVRVGKIEADWLEQGATAIPIGESKEIYFNVIPNNLQIRYEITLSEGGKFITCEMKDGYLLVTASETAVENLIDGYGFEEITLTVWFESQPNEKITLTKKTVNVYQ